MLPVVSADYNRLAAHLPLPPPLQQSYTRSNEHMQGSLERSRSRALVNVFCSRFIP